MKFQINITGEFNNVKGLRIVQRYYMDIQCGSCNTLYPKTIFISEENWKSLKIHEHTHRREFFNVTVKCKNCENMMGIVIEHPENQIEIEEDFFISPVINDKCHVSTIISDSAVVKAIDGLILDSVSNQGEVFKNCAFDGRTLAEDDHKGRTIDIQKFNIEVEQVK